jgi:uncharacterized protein (DUF2147 family)
MKYAALALAALVSTGGSAFAASPLGDWMTEDGAGIVRIGPCGSIQVGSPPPAAARPGTRQPAAKPDPAAPLCGLLAWSRNDDPGKDDKSFIGTKILSDMKPAGNNRWEGEVTNPTNGKVYQSFMGLRSENVLRIEGCVLGFLCGGQDWTRHTAPLPTSTTGQSPRR